uniref:Predicted protein n=1 Tax=Hordeum vulgare subsp. vulgare TaxID=112509 RepID=F2E0M7_HORVV|nr:predicted protein [Hordeum vulgare subsp. vulgare]
MLDMFENGVVLNFDKFPQYRVMKAREHSGRNKSKFIFCPTYLVTTKMFQGLNNGSLGNLLISGSYGTGKSVSIILFIHLSEYINKFFKAAKS